jgi:hypothetical protein
MLLEWSNQGELYGRNVYYEWEKYKCIESFGKNNTTWNTKLWTDG